MEVERWRVWLRAGLRRRAASWRCAALVAGAFAVQGCSDLITVTATPRLEEDPLGEVSAITPRGSSGANEDLELITPGSASDDLGLLGDDASCASETRAREEANLDILIMLDTSASMLDPLPAQDLAAAPQTKWDAVKASIKAFVEARETRTIGIGLQYFPQLEPGVPFTCETNLECGSAGGPCSNSICVENDTFDLNLGDNEPPFTYVRATASPPEPCFEEGDCPGFNQTCSTVIGQCVFQPSADLPSGLIAGFELDGVVFPPLCTVDSDCAAVPGTRCERLGLCNIGFSQSCSQGVACPASAGSCVDAPPTCVGATKCDAADYATPAVPISETLTRSQDIITSIDGRAPNGRTPTAPALAGALDHASSWATEHPGRQVVTVFATDGLPTQCSPLDVTEIATIAAAGLAATPSIKTFVIGVFSQTDLANGGQDRLNLLAEAGGTDGAFLVNTGGDVTQSFLDALNVIQSTVIDCDFELPQTGPPLDYQHVNLTVIDENGGAQQVYNVGTAEGCALNGDQGWYYVTGATNLPTRITVCPGVCDAFAAGAVSAELAIGCATVIR